MLAMGGECLVIWCVNWNMWKIDTYTSILWNVERFLMRAMVNYRKKSNISRTLLGNQIVDHSDVGGASPVGTAPNTSSFST